MFFTQYLFSRPDSTIFTIQARQIHLVHFVSRIRRTIMAFTFVRCRGIRNALRWNKNLVDGETGSMQELATQYDVTQRYVAHLIKLAWLSPDIIKAIKQGRVPATLSLDRLKKGFPLDWDQQWKTLGFDSLH